MTTKETRENEIIPGMLIPEVSTFAPIEKVNSQNLEQLKTQITTILLKIKSFLVDEDDLQLQIGDTINIMQQCINVLIYAGYPNDGVPAFTQLTKMNGPESVTLFWEDIVKELNMEFSTIVDPLVLQAKLSESSNQTLFDSWYDLSDSFKKGLRELSKKSVQRLEQDKKKHILEDIKYIMYDLGKTVEYEDAPGAWTDIAVLKDLKAIETKTHSNFLSELLQTSAQFFWNGIKDGTKDNDVLQKTQWDNFNITIKKEDPSGTDIRKEMPKKAER